MYIIKRPVYAGEKTFIISTIQQRIDDTICVSYEMDEDASQLTKVLVSLLNEIYNEPVDLMREHTDDEH